MLTFLYQAFCLLSILKCPLNYSALNPKHPMPFSTLPSALLFLTVKNISILLTNIFTGC